MSDTYVPVEYPKMIHGVVVENEDEEKMRVDSLPEPLKSDWIKANKERLDKTKAIREQAAKDADAHNKAMAAAVKARDEADAKAAKEARELELKAPPMAPTAAVDEQAMADDKRMVDQAIADKAAADKRAADQQAARDKAASDADKPATKA